jgi:Txe/YoeB family toxin of Txe-Axe toxin-antitoxin module
MLELVEEINRLIKSVSRTAYQRMLLPAPAEYHAKGWSSRGARQQIGEIRTFTVDPQKARDFEIDSNIAG